MAKIKEIWAETQDVLAINKVTMEMLLTPLIFSFLIYKIRGASLVAQIKVSASTAGDPGSIPGSGRSPGEGNGNSLQYSCLENSVDGGAW